MRHSPLRPRSRVTSRSPPALHLAHNIPSWETLSLAGWKASHCRGCVISQLARISSSIETTRIQEIRQIVKINAVVFLCDAIVGIGL